MRGPSRSLVPATRLLLPQPGPVGAQPTSLSGSTAPGVVHAAPVAITCALKTGNLISRPMCVLSCGPTEKLAFQTSPARHLVLVHPGGCHRRPWTEELTDKKHLFPSVWKLWIRYLARAALRAHKAEQVREPLGSVFQRH